VEPSVNTSMTKKPAADIVSTVVGTLADSANHAGTVRGFVLSAVTSMNENGSLDFPPRRSRRSILVRAGQSGLPGFDDLKSTVVHETNRPS
jgi:hypothetical protein